MNVRIILVDLNIGWDSGGNCLGRRSYYKRIAWLQRLRLKPGNEPTMKIPIVGEAGTGFERCQRAFQRQKKQGEKWRPSGLLRALNASGSLEVAQRVPGCPLACPTSWPGKTAGPFLPALIALLRLRAGVGFELWFRPNSWVCYCWDFLPSFFHY